jgi:anti-sigma B factor antagonist
MNFESHERNVEGIIILDLRGRLVAGETALLRERLSDLKDQKNQINVILNLKNVDFIDSSGLGTLIAGHSIIAQGGGDLRLLNLSKRSAQLLILTKLTTVFQIFDDEQAAVNSFFAGREVKRFDILEFIKSQEQE